MADAGSNHSPAFGLAVAPRTGGQMGPQLFFEDLPVDDPKEIIDVEVVGRFGVHRNFPFFSSSSRNRHNAIRAAARRLLTVPDRNIEDFGDLGHRDLRGENQPENLPMGASKHPDRVGHVGHVGHVGALERDELGPGIRTRLGDQGAVLDLSQPVTAEPVPGLTPCDCDHPRADARVPTERARLTPDGEHRVLEDLLTEDSIIYDEDDLTQYHSTVPPVQLRQGVIVASCHAPEELDVLAVRVGCYYSINPIDRLTETVHQKASRSISHKQVSSS
jgi:hypothetical protein